MKGIVINTNMASELMQNSLRKATNDLLKSMEKISTGKKINSAADGAADLAIATGFFAQSQGSAVARENAQQGILLLQQADTALQKVIDDNLVKIRNLAVEAADETYTQDQRDLLKAEAQGYVDEINRLSQSTSFNGVKLLDGSATKMQLQIGANSSDTLEISSALTKIDATTLGVSNLNDAFSSAQKANEFIGTVDSAIKKTSLQLSKVGAYDNSLNSAIDSLDTKILNMDSAYSQVMDADIAKEMMNYTKNLLLRDVSAYLEGQANIMPAQALKLLGFAQS
ncbi:MAG: flagellin [Eubacteriales bacterium]|nr:flagellin [Eubacteriales bacterium]